ncbi:hypothetical protein Trydic_g12449 [Trypoxylus dichotomus]
MNRISHNIWFMTSTHSDLVFLNSVASSPNLEDQRNFSRGFLPLVKGLPLWGAGECTQSYSSSRFAGRAECYLVQFQVLNPGRPETRICKFYTQER